MISRTCYAIQRITPTTDYTGNTLQNRNMHNVTDVNIELLASSVYICLSDKCFLWHSIHLSIGTDRSASYLNLHLKIDSEGRLRTKLYDKRDDFNFPFVNYM